VAATARSLTKAGDEFVVLQKIAEPNP